MRTIQAFPHCSPTGARTSDGCQNRGMTTPSSSLPSSIADLRKSYERAELSEDASHADPFKQFDQWLSEALAARGEEALSPAGGQHEDDGQ